MFGQRLRRAPNRGTRPKDARPYCVRAEESCPVRGGQRLPAEGNGQMVRLICLHCGCTFLRIIPPDEEEEVVCPRCLRAFVPDEAELVDPEDDV